MNIKYILIVLGEPYSTFSEIIGKYFSKIRKFKRKIIIIGNKNLLEKQLKYLNYKLKINEINNYDEAKKNKINIININFKHKKIFDKISKKSNNYIENSFQKSLEIIKKEKNNLILINGPVSKKTFLKKKFSGITEYLAKNTKSSHETMLIYNNKISVSPLTTHIPIKNVAKEIKKNKIYMNVINLYNFYKKILNKRALFAVLGLNPHCETIDKFDEDEKIIKPSIKYLKSRGLNINGPYSADTFFLKKNVNKFDLVVGMYHDQVLTPIKTLFGFEAINITIGLPFIRISPDHGPNHKMAGKKLSDPTSIFYALEFINKFK